MFPLTDAGDPDQVVLARWAGARDGCRRLRPDGKSLRGEVGEFVCLKPWPAMTRGVWRDRERYLDAYWRRFPGVWTHGDWALVDADGYWFLFGRSDDTLNIAGKRIGPAEIESALVEHPAVAEAGVAGIPHEVKGEVPWCFCVLVPGDGPAPSWRRNSRVRSSRRWARAFAERIVFVEALPKTRSAKIVRRALRALATGEDPGDISSLEDPRFLSASLPSFNMKTELPTDPGVRPALRFGR